MSECYLICRSLTYAQRTLRVLERWGLYAALVRMPSELRDGSGCGWCVRLRQKEVQRALQAVRTERLAPVRAFCRGTDGTLREVFDALA